MKIPRPNPDFDFIDDLYDLLYGSPIFLNTSLGYPSPSSSIITSVTSESLLIFIKTLLFENLFAFPIKFLNP